MGQRLSPEDMAPYRAIDEVLHYIWDPIGISDAPEARDEEQALMAIAKLDRPLKVLDTHLAKQRYVLGDRFTVADLNIATVMDLAPQCGIALDAWPSVKAWHERCLSRPAAADWKDVNFRIPRPPTPLGILKMFV